MTAHQETKDLFELSTQIAPPRTFKIDGESYYIKDLRHLNDIEEARYRTLMKTDERLMKRMEEAVSKGRRGDEIAQAVGLRLRQNRISILILMTDVPKELLEKLSFPDQARLISETVTAGLSAAQAALERADDIPTLEGMEDEFPEEGSE